MNIHLHIERLILDGLPVERNQAPHIQAALEAELTSLLAQNGLASQFHAGGSVPHLETNLIDVASGGSPTHMGTQIARSIYSGVGSNR